MSGMDLTEFLLDRIAEDEEAMRRITGRRWYACDDGHVQEPEVDPDIEEVEDRLPNHHNSWALVLDPARVLAECAAKRRIVEQSQILSRHGTGRVTAPDMRWVLTTLAAVYADHPDYDQSWRPE